MSRSAWALTLSVAAVAAVLVALVLVVRSTVPDLPEPLADLAASDARARARALGADLTEVVREGGDASPSELTAAVDGVLAAGTTAGGYEPLDGAGATSVWRAQLSGSAHRGGVLPSMAVAVLCVDVTIDRGAEPPVRMTDADCLSEPRDPGTRIPVDPPGRAAGHGSDVRGRAVDSAGARPSQW